MMNRHVALGIAVLTLVVFPLAGQEMPPVAAAPAAATAGTPAAPQAAAPAETVIPHTYLEKATVVVDGKARANGSLKIEFLAVGGEPRVVEVKVLADTKKKDIARDIHKELALVAGAGYKVKHSGDEVRITKRDKKAPNISVVVMQLALPGVSVFVK